MKCSTDGNAGKVAEDNTNSHLWVATSLERTGCESTKPIRVRYNPVAMFGKTGWVDSPLNRN